jgi:hypothetical protein
MRGVMLVTTIGCLALCVPLPAAATPTCAAVRPAIVHSALGITVPPAASSSTSSFGGFTYLDCGYGLGASIEFISPSTSAGFKTLLTMVGKAAKTETVAGVGTKAFSGTGTSTVANVVAGGKTKMTALTTENLWVYVAGKAIFEIVVPNGKLPREEALAKEVVRLV